MGCGGCITFFKVILVIVNIIFFLIGLLMLGFGIALKAFTDKTLQMFSSNSDLLKLIPTDFLGNIGWFMIALGIVVMLISVLGFFGALRKIMCMLIAYTVIIIIILLGEVALIVFVTAFPTTAKNLVENEISKTLITNFATQDIQIQPNGSYTLPQDSYGKIWIAVQFKLRCCGVDGPQQSYSSLSDQQRSETLPTGVQGSPVVPISCCALWSNVTTFPPTSKDQFVDITKCVGNTTAYTDPSINQNGCYTQVYALVNDFSRIPIGIAAGTICLLVLLVIFAITLTCAARNKKNADAGYHDNKVPQNNKNDEYNPYYAQTLDSVVVPY